MSLNEIVRDLTVNTVAASRLLPRRLRPLLLRAFGLQVHYTAVLSPGTFYGSRRVEIGPGAVVGHQCFIDALEWVTLGERCSLAARVSLITSTHDVGSAKRRAGRLRADPIDIGAGAWLGAGVTVLPGVSIGQGAVVAAGAVVTADVPPNTMVAGVPARVMRSLTEHLEAVQ